MSRRESTPRDRVPAMAVTAACVAVFLWMGLGWRTLLLRESYLGKKGDYYSQEVEGFLSGHLYMNPVADFRRESPEPAIRAKALYMLDTSYYRGRYYLYYGVTPAALVLLPYAWATGQDLDPRFVVVLGAVAGFLFSVGVFRMARRDHFPLAGSGFQALAIVVLAFGTAVPLLLTRAIFYEVAIAAGYACAMAAAFWMYRALSGRGRPLVQLALASLSLGLAVGCRPDFLFALPVLAAAALLLARRERGSAPAGSPLARHAAAAVVPAALIGVCLALYNYERFGSPFEFGFRYVIDSFFVTHDSLFGVRFLWANLHWYYLTPPALSPYFPYAFPEMAAFGPRGYASSEAMHGQAPVCALAAFVVLSALALRGRLALGRLGAYLGLLAAWFLSVFLFYCLIAVHADRYAVDFQAPLALGIVLLAGAIAAAPWVSGGRGAWLGAFGALAAFAAAVNFFGGLQEFEAFKYTRILTYRALETVGNYPSHWLERLGALRSGPVELKVVFPTDVKTAVIEPLLTAGTPEYSDSLYAIEWPGGRRIELVADHNGYGGPHSREIEIVPGKAYTLKVDMGALYPPLRHPFFATYKTLQAREVKKTVRVEMDGATVMDDRMDSYDAPPWSVEIGKNHATMTTFGTDFSGKILSERRLARPSPEKLENTGLWRVRCVLPMKDVNSSFPLFSSGSKEAGDLVYVSILPGGEIRFGLDESGTGGSVSDALVPAPRAEHVIEIFAGSVAGRTRWRESWAISPRELGRAGNSLRVWLDGRLVWRTRLHRPLDPKDPGVDLGGNLQSFSTASPEFPGFIKNEPYSPEEARAFLNHNVEDGSNGLWRMQCVFPLQDTRGSFPLVACGVTGSGAMVYLNVLPGNRVRFGLDEWGVGGGFSEPVGCAPDAVHVIEIFDGTLASKASWPQLWAIAPSRLAAASHSLKVWLDGRLVWSTSLRRPQGPSDSLIGVGTNFQGFSTAPSEYPGVIQFDPYAGDDAREFLQKNLKY